MDALGIHPDEEHPLVKVGRHPFVVETHVDMEDGKIGLSLWQIHHKQFGWGDPVSVKYFQPASSLALASVEFSVDFHHGTNPFVLDTEQMAIDLSKVLANQPVEAGSTILMKYGQTMTFLTVTVKKVGVMSSDRNRSECRNMGIIFPNIHANMTFCRSEDSSSITSVGNHLA